MNQRRAIVLLLVGWFPFMGWATEPEENSFVYAQIDKGDPHPSVWPLMREALTRATSARARTERVRVNLTDDRLFDYPFLVLLSREAVAFSAEETARLRLFLERGGTLFIDDVNADPNGPFARSVLALGKRC